MQKGVGVGRAYQRGNPKHRQSSSSKCPKKSKRSRFAKSASPCSRPEAYQMLSQLKVSLTTSTGTSTISLALPPLALPPLAWPFALEEPPTARLDPPRETGRNLDMTRRRVPSFGKLGGLGRTKDVQMKTCPFHVTR